MDNQEELETIYPGLQRSRVEVPLDRVDTRGHRLFSARYGGPLKVELNSFEDRRAYIYHHPTECTRCGERPRWSFTETSGEVWMKTTDSCADMEPPTGVVTLAISSGKLRFGERLLDSELYDELQDYGTMSLNNSRGQLGFAKLLEQFGVLFICAEYSQAIWIHEETGELLISSPAQVEDEEGYEVEVAPAGYRKLSEETSGGYFLEVADAEALTEENGLLVEEDSQVVSVPAGVYDFTIYTRDSAAEEPWGTEQIYARGRLKSE